MKTGFKIRFYPADAQKRTLSQWFGHARFVWNLGLEMRSKAWRRRQERVSGVDIQKHLTKLKKDAFPWLGNVPTSCLQQSIRDQDTAFTNFFEGRAEYPRFKKRTSTQSVRVTIDWRHLSKAQAWKSGQLKLPGIGHVCLRGRKLPKERPSMVAVSRDAAGRYFVSFNVEVEQPSQVEAAHHSVGVDLDTKNVIVTSRGERFDNVKATKRFSEKLKELQQRLARQVKGSKRREKTRRQIAHLHVRIADCRRENTHRISHCVARQNQIVCAESPNVRGMTSSAKGDWENPGKNVAQKSGLNRTVLDAAFGETLRQLEYKCHRFGHAFVQVDQWFPSSKLCSVCGHKNTKLTLGHEVWTCEVCETVHDRDINGASTIEVEGLRIFYGESMEDAAEVDGREHPEVTGMGRSALVRTGVVRASGGGSEGLLVSGSAAVSARIAWAVSTTSGTA